MIEPTHRTAGVGCTLRRSCREQSSCSAIRAAATPRARRKSRILSRLAHRRESALTALLLLSDPASYSGGALSYRQRRDARGARAQHELSSTGRTPHAVGAITQGTPRRRARVLARACPGRGRRASVLPVPPDRPAPAEEHLRSRHDDAGKVSKIESLQCLTSSLTVCQYLMNLTKLNRVYRAPTGTGTGTGTGATQSTWSTVVNYTRYLYMQTSYKTGGQISWGGRATQGGCGGAASGVITVKDLFAREAPSAAAAGAHSYVRRAP